MRLKRITVRNFQSHKNLTLDLGQITVVQGDTDSGKSSLIRALSAFINNELDEGYTRWGQSSYMIELENVRGSVASATRSPKGVEYKLTLPGEKTVSFTKTNRTVPKEIRDEFRMYDYQIDDDLKLSFSVAEQFDNQFILTMPPTDAAKILGRVTNLHVVMAATRSMANDKTKAVQEKNLLTELLAAKRLESTKFNSFDSLKAKLSAVEAQFARYSEFMSGSENLLKTVTELKQVELDLAAATAAEAIVSDSALIELDLSIVRQLQVSVDDLKAIPEVVVPQFPEDDVLGASHEILAVVNEIKSLPAIVEIPTFDEVDLVGESFLAALEVVRLGAQFKVDALAIDFELTAADAEVTKALNDVIENVGDICPITEDAFCTSCKEKLTCA